ESGHLGLLKVACLVLGRRHVAIGSSRRRVLNQSTHSNVANSTASRCRQGPRRRMTSVLNKPMTDSASGLSYESPRLPTDGADPSLGQPVGVAHGEVLGTAITAMDQP